MNDLIANLPSRARVLDLGARSGSFRSDRGDITVVRLDLENPGERQSGAYIIGDAACMPLSAGSFELVISNHSLEHFSDMHGALREIGRVLKPGGGLYIAVPDATTLTDRIYRWLGRGGGHVNAFRRPEDVIDAVRRDTGLEYRGGYVLYSGLSFLNRRNISGRRGKKMVLFLGGSERLLSLLLWTLKRIDRLTGTRLAIYGWTFFFGSATPDRHEPWPNVCVRCGAGLPTAARIWTCPSCGCHNLGAPKPIPSRTST
jgi:SAM-dependent methyltransferase